MANVPDRQSHRLKWFDYSSSHVYFVTICTHDREHFFGCIRNEIMYLNEAGILSRSVWVSLPDRFPGVLLDDFIFMPNHVHGLIVLYQRTSVQNMPSRFQAYHEQKMEEQWPEMKQPYKPPTLGEIVRVFKGASTHHIRAAGTHHFAWQKNYWDVIVRNDTRLSILRNYIHDNPRRWEKDTLYKPTSQAGF